MSDKVYCYPDTNILKNKLEITEKEKLLRAECRLASIRLLELQKKPIKGNFDFKHLRNIHKYIFQDLYAWAGEVRTVNIGKGNLFCLVQHIPAYAASIFPEFAADCMKVRNDREKFIRRLAGHYGDLNALHPFREGNGRSQREFVRELCLKCGYAFDLTQTCHEEMLRASILSFDKGDNSGLEEVFARVVKVL